jgi:hypothetical protein
MAASILEIMDTILYLSPSPGTYLLLQQLSLSETDIPLWIVQLAMLFADMH